MKRTANFLLGLCLAMALTSAQAVTAVAFSNATSSAGASFDAPSKESAMAGAVENCKKNGGGDDCKVFKVTEERGFAAVYMACASGCGVTAVTGRPSQLQARMDGRQDCQRYYKMPCKLAVEWEERGYQDPTRMAAAPPPPKPAFENKPDDYYRAFAAIKGFKDCAECPEMVNIPAGSFDMGWPARDGEKADQHRVSITGFAMGRTEVTVGQWRAFMRATGRIMAEIGCSANILVQKTVKVQGWRNPGYPISDAHPVSCVDWEDAQAYVEWLTYKTKKPYRLPSEAEWEYAARAGTTTTFPWGDDPQQACKHANVYDMTAEAVDRSIGANPFKHCNDGQLYPTAVASYLPNRFGLYDMIGNLEEWTEDCWYRSYAGAPADGSARTEAGCGKYVTRGGSWLLYGDVSVRRYQVGDAYFLLSNHLPIHESHNVKMGFRVALSTDPQVVARWRQKKIDELRPVSPPTDAERAFGDEQRRQYNLDCFNSPGFSEACSKRY